MSNKFTIHSEKGSENYNQRVSVEIKNREGLLVLRCPENFDLDEYLRLNPNAQERVNKNIAKNVATHFQIPHLTQGQITDDELNRRGYKYAPITYLLMKNTEIESSVARELKAKEQDEYLVYTLMRFELSDIVQNSDTNQKIYFVLTQLEPKGKKSTRWHQVVFTGQDGMPVVQSNLEPSHQLLAKYIGFWAEKAIPIIKRFKIDPQSFGEKFDPVLFATILNIPHKDTLIPPSGNITPTSWVNGD